MSNGEVCCILGVCCPAGGKAQFEHLVSLIQKSRPAFTTAQVNAAAVRVLEKHDFFKGVAVAIDAALEA